jgi:hypothetical protein
LDLRATFCPAFHPVVEAASPEQDLYFTISAIEALMLCSRGGPTMMARIGVVPALNREHVRELDGENASLGTEKA